MILCLMDYTNTNVCPAALLPIAHMKHYAHTKKRTHVHIWTWFTLHMYNLHLISVCFATKTVFDEVVIVYFTACWEFRHGNCGMELNR